MGSIDFTSREKAKVTGKAVKLKSSKTFKKLSHQ